MDSIYQFDFAILDALQTLHCTVLNYIMAFFTTIGNNGYAWILVTILLLLIKKYRVIGLASALSLIIEFVLNDLILKNLIARPRPFTLRPEIDTIVSQPSSYSFPSGHTASAFAAATAIFMFDKRLGTIAYVVATLIGFSRNYFFIHYPTDVLCGALLGILVGVLCSLLIKQIVKRLDQRQEPPSQPQHQ